MESNADIRRELELAATTVDAVTSEINDMDMDSTIDKIVDAANRLELDDDEDNEDIDLIEGLPEEEVEIEADDEHHAAELELMADIESGYADDAEELSDEIKDSADLQEAYYLIDDDLINFITLKEYSEEI